MTRCQILIGQIVEFIALEFINNESLRLPFAVNHHKSNTNSFHETNVDFFFIFKSKSDRKSGNSK